MLVGGVVFDLFDPFCQTLERSSAGDVENQQGSNCAPVVGPGDGLVGFLACGIPNLQFDFFIPDLKGFGPEFHSNGGVGVNFEHPVYKLHEYATFANACIKIRILVSPTMMYLKRKE